MSGAHFHRSAGAGDDSRDFTALVNEAWELGKDAASQAHDLEPRLSLDAFIEDHEHLRGDVNYPYVLACWQKACDAADEQLAKMMRECSLSEQRSVSDVALERHCLMKYLPKSVSLGVCLNFFLPFAD